MSGVAIVCPGYPDRPGGVTDHTRRLVGHWSKGRPVLVYGEADGDAPALVAGWKRDGVTALLLQYVPFLYGRRGLSRFPEALISAARAQGLRSTVFVHEPWVPPTRLPWLFLRPLQRRQLLRLVQRADRVVTAVPAWRVLLGGHVDLVAVGSTLGPTPANPGTALTAPVVFSPLAAGLRWDWILAATRAVQATPPLIVIGATRDAVTAHLGAQSGDPSFDWRGRLAPEDAMALLARAPIVLAPFLDGMTGRRTSALAALSAGARVVTSRGPLYDPAFVGGPDAADSSSEFAAIARARWSESDTAAARTARRAWHDERFDPETLDHRLARITLGSEAA